MLRYFYLTRDIPVVANASFSVWILTLQTFSQVKLIIYIWLVMATKISRMLYFFFRTVTFLLRYFLTDGLDLSFRFISNVSLATCSLERKYCFCDFLQSMRSPSPLLIIIFPNKPLIKADVNSKQISKRNRNVSPWLYVSVYGSGLLQGAL